MLLQMAENWLNIGMKFISCHIFHEILMLMDLVQELLVLVLFLSFSQKLAKRPLTVVGSGKQTRDFIHITDIVVI